MTKSQPVAKPTSGGTAAESPSIADAALQRNLIQRVNLGDLLTRSAARSPQQTAILDRGRQFSFLEANHAANRLAHGLTARGFRRGDTVTLYARNSAEFLMVYFACAKIGVVLVPINLLWQQREVGYVLQHARVRAAICDASLLPTLGPSLIEAGVTEVFVIGDDAAPIGNLQLTTLAQLSAGQPEAEPQQWVEDRDPLTYLYTSGTTSAPKGVVGSHLAIYLNSLAVAIEYQLTRKDRIGVVLPLFHTAALNALATPAVAVTASLALFEGFDAPSLLDAIERDGITLMLGIPAMYRALRGRTAASAAQPQQPASGDVCHGADAGSRVAHCHGSTGLRVFAGVRTDRDEPACRPTSPRPSAGVRRRCGTGCGQRRGGDHGRARSPARRR